MVKDQREREDDKGEKQEDKPTGTIIRLKPLTKCFHIHRIKGLFLLTEHQFLVHEEIQYSGYTEGRYVTP